MEIRIFRWQDDESRWFHIQTTIPVQTPNWATKFLADEAGDHWIYPRIMTTCRTWIMGPITTTTLQSGPRVMLFMPKHPHFKRSQILMSIMWPASDVLHVSLVYEKITWSPFHQQETSCSYVKLLELEHMSTSKGCHHPLLQLQAMAYIICEWKVDDKLHETST